MKNSVSDEVVEILRSGGDFSAVRELVAGRRGREIYATGDLEAGIWSAGISQALIHDVPSCVDLIAEIVREAEEAILGRLPGLVR